MTEGTKSQLIAWDLELHETRRHPDLDHVMTAFRYAGRQLLMVLPTRAPEDDDPCHVLDPFDPVLGLAQLVWSIRTAVSQAHWRQVS